EGKLLQAAQTMDPGQFMTVAKNFEHRVDAAGALAEANHAYQRRYFHIGEPQDGIVRLDGVVDAEGGATLRTALEPFMKPVKDDARNYGQRSVDALMELCRQGSGSRRDGAGPRPQLIVRASPLNWCDGHHLVWWTRGGATALPNLALLCRPHHRMVHEEGWSLRRLGAGWRGRLTRAELTGAGGFRETLEHTAHPTKLIDLF